jgi:hypothetical protein
VPSVTIEYVILIPLLFSQVIVFPFVASTMTSSWQNSQRNIELQDAAGHLASTIQQLYLTINSEDILEGTVTYVSSLPITVGSYPYDVTGSLSDPPGDSAKVLTVTLTLDELGNTATASAVLGDNVEWTDSTLRSNSADASINVVKDVDGTLTFSFGGSG